MGIPLADIIATMPKKQRAAIAKRTEEMLAQEMTLRDLRKVMGKTQAQIAKRTGKPQAAISRIEGQADMLLSTLNEMVEAIGGQVRLIAELPGRDPVVLTGFGDLAKPGQQRKQAA